jgi:hypothetical protein
VTIGVAVAGTPKIGVAIVLEVVGRFIVVVVGDEVWVDDDKLKLNGFALCGIGWVEVLVPVVVSAPNKGGLIEKGLVVSEVGIFPNGNEEPLAKAVVTKVGLGEAPEV